MYYYVYIFIYIIKYTQKIETSDDNVCTCKLMGVIIHMFEKITLLYYVILFINYMK